MPPRRKKGPGKGQNDQGWVFLGNTGGDRPAEPGADGDDISMADIEEAFRENPEILEQLKALTEQALQAFTEKHGRPPNEEEFLAELGFDEDDEDAEGVANFLDGIFDDIDDDDLEAFPLNDEDEDEDDEGEDEGEDEENADGDDTPPPTTGRGRRR